MFVAAAQGISLDCLVARDIPGSPRTVTVRDTVLRRLPLPGHCTDSGLKLSLSLSAKESCFPILEIWP